MRRRSALLFLSLVLIPFATIVRAQEGTVESDSVEADTAELIVAEPEDTTTVSIATPDTTGLDSTLQAWLATARDSSAIEVRRPSDSTLAAMREEDDFRYDRSPGSSESLWDVIKQWLRQIFFDTVTSDRTEPFWKVFPYVLFGGALIFVLWMLFKSDVGGIFSRRAGVVAPGFEEVIENIHEMDFDALIAQAVRDGKFRGAVRLLYLRTLKLLADRELIEWRRDKTNREYLSELRDTDLRAPFARATVLFEYVWYGDFPVDGAAFERINETFTSIGQQLTRPR